MTYFVGRDDKNFFSQVELFFKKNTHLKQIDER